jgi:hypothetical protein
MKPFKCRAKRAVFLRTERTEPEADNCATGVYADFIQIPDVLHDETRGSIYFPNLRNKNQPVALSFLIYFNNYPLTFRRD